MRAAQHKRIKRLLLLWLFRDTPPHMLYIHYNSLIILLPPPPAHHPGPEFHKDKKCYSRHSRHIDLNLWLYQPLITPLNLAFKPFFCGLAVIFGPVYIKTDELPTDFLNGFLDERIGTDYFIE